MNTFSGSSADKIALGEGTVILKFHATWCGPCKKIAPSFSKFAEDKRTITFYEVDINDHPHLTEKYKVDAVPTVIKLVNGKVAREWVGGACVVADIEKSLD